jgi:hypothetical protein
MNHPTARGGLSRINNPMQLRRDEKTGLRCQRLSVGHRRRAGWMTTGAYKRLLPSHFLAEQSCAPAPHLILSESQREDGS